MNAALDEPLAMWPTSSRARSTAIALGTTGALIAGVILIAWLMPGGPVRVATSMKTNTAVGLLLSSVSVCLLATRGPGRVALAVALGLCATVIGLATQLQYVSGTDFGIDQLIANDVIVPESARFPNRMSPIAAMCLMLVGPAAALLPRGLRLARIAHGLFVLVLAINLLSLVGYLYEMTFLYRPLPFIRISPYSNVAFVCIAAGALALRGDIGFTRWLVDPGAPGVLVRRLLWVVLPLPIVMGWVLLEASEFVFLSVAARTALFVIAIVFVLLLALMVSARALAGLERQRAARVDDLHRELQIAGAFAKAFTVEQVADAAVRIAGPAFGAAASGLYLRSADGTRLTLAAASGHTAAALDRLGDLAGDAQLPHLEVLRTNDARFIPHPAAFVARYGDAQHEHLQYRAWAMLPLHGRDRMLGVLGLSFAQERAFDSDETERLRLLASQCAQALERALLFDAERAASERLAAALEAAEGASRAKDEFLAMLGHELRNPLAPIVTALGLMELRGLDAFEKERGIIGRQVEHMTQLIDDLLDVARIARGKVTFTPVHLSIADIVATAVETTSPLFERSSHDVQVAVEPELYVMGDARRLAQVVSNLLSNAAKFTPPGGRIAISARRVDEQIEISVEDNGEGISQTLLPKLFELFSQGERTMERAQGGLGLGLSIVRNLVQLHGGSVRAESAGVGRGSTFTVCLPAAAGVVEAPAQGGAPAEPTEPAREPGRRILVVDDNADAAEMLAELLREVGHTVEVAHDGPSALAQAEAFRPQLVFLDIGLPVMDGFEVCRKLRSSQSSALQLVALTGYGQPSDRERSKREGFDEHLVKPIDIKRALSLASGG